jgi:hypothetical protein
MPGIEEKHSMALLAAGGVMVTAGGGLMAVTAVEPSKTPRSIWANAWFGIGFTCVIISLMLMLVGLYLNFRKNKRASAGERVTCSVPLPATNTPGTQLPPLLVRIPADWTFESYLFARIAALPVEIENMTSRSILIDRYEFISDDEGRPQWHHQATYKDRRSVLDEIERRDLSQEYGQPLRSFTRIPAHCRITGWLLEPVSRNPAGGTPECTVVVIDDFGNRYLATLPRQEPRTFDPVSG